MREPLNFDDLAKISNVKPVRSRRTQSDGGRERERMRRKHVESEGEEEDGEPQHEIPQVKTRESTRNCEVNLPVVPSMYLHSCIDTFIHAWMDMLAYRRCQAVYCHFCSISLRRRVS